MLVHLLVLNYNGRELLGECLPSVVEAAAASRHECRVAVIDNDSTDDSVEWLAGTYPAIAVIRSANRGLCSFNDVLDSLDGPVAVLLNNDIKLDRAAIDPLVAPLANESEGGQPNCFMTAPHCRLFDGITYEGFKTSVRWRWGLVQATALFPGCEAAACEPGLTASAGAAIAVRCELFRKLGGFDPVYLPGRLEDLDFCYRGFLAGYYAQYVPESIVYHRGMATFGAVYGRRGCDRLALRNTLIFQWKNLRHPVHRLRQISGGAVRLAADAVRAPWSCREDRWLFARAVGAAISRRSEAGGHGSVALADAGREREFFARFHPRQLISEGVATPPSDEERRAANYPLSRWYIRPLAGWAARALSATSLRPWHVTVCGLLFGFAAALLLVADAVWAPVAALLVLAAWFCDRTDGQLARLQGTVSSFGAWLDANVDELLDAAWHVGLACAAAASGASWLLLAAFLSGKYLFMHSLATEPLADVKADSRNEPARVGWLQWLYHLPGNADVRIHLLLLALVTGLFAAELALVAAYYHFRWMARYPLVLRRLRAAA